MSDRAELASNDSQRHTPTIPPPSDLERDAATKPAWNLTAEDIAAIRAKMADSQAWFDYFCEERLARRVAESALVAEREKREAAERERDEAKACPMLKCPYEKQVADLQAKLAAAEWERDDHNRNRRTLATDLIALAKGEPVVTGLAAQVEAKLTQAEAGCAVAAELADIDDACQAKVPGASLFGKLFARVREWRQAKG